MTDREEILRGFDRIAKQRFGETAHAEFSDNDHDVVEVHTAQISVNAKDISRFDTACNLKCWITTNAAHEVIICREIL